MKRLIFILTLILVCNSCKKAGDIFKSYGDEVEKTRQVGSFHSVSAGEKFDIELIQDSALAGTVKITAGSHVIDGYTTEVNDGMLSLKNTNTYNWVRKLKVRQKVVIYFKVLDFISVTGSAKFTAHDTIRQKNELRISHNGLEDIELNIITNDIDVRGENTGGIVLRGRCNIFRGNADDISFVDNRNLVTDDTYFNNYSQENSYVDAKNILGLKVYGNGNTYYTITPSNSLKTKFESFGKGQVIKL